MATHVNKGRRPGRLRMGLALAKDRRIPIHVKFLALTVGVSIMVILLAFEVPLEAVVAAIVPILGIPFDFAFDGFELLALPILIAFLVLPSLVPSRLRTELGLG